MIDPFQSDAFGGSPLRTMFLLTCVFFFGLLRAGCGDNNVGLKKLGGFSESELNGFNFGSELNGWGRARIVGGEQAGMKDAPWQVKATVNHFTQFTVACCQSVSKP